MTPFLVIVVLCTAAFCHGFTGFGSAMVTMALLPLLLDLKEVLFLGALFTLPAAVLIFVANRRHFSWGDAWPLLAGAAVGTPVGLLIVAHLDRRILIRGLGAVLILFSLNELVFAHLWTMRVPHLSGLPIGIVCGILGAAFNIGGPPALIWVYSRPWSREQAIATLQMMFLFNSGLRVVLTAPSGVVTPELATLCAIALVPFLVVAVLGNRLATRVSPTRFKQIILLALMGMGVHYLVNG